MLSENLELLTIALIGLCAVSCLVVMMFGVVLLEGLVDKKLAVAHAVLRASVYGGYTVVFGALMVSCVIATAMCYVRLTPDRSEPVTAANRV